MSGATDVTALLARLRRRLRALWRSRRPVLSTTELRLSRIVRGSRQVELDVEVSWTDALAGLQPAWEHADVRLGAHWLYRDGSLAVWDGPRSEPIDLRWLRRAPVVRRVTLPLPPAAPQLQIELVAESVAWGSEHGLAVLEMPLQIGRVAPPRKRPGQGPEAPGEPAGRTLEWLAAAWPEDADSGEMRIYATFDLARFLMTVQLVKEVPPRTVLEIGANPYFITRLLHRECPEAAFALTNFFGKEGSSLEQRLVRADGQPVASLRSDIVDIEASPLPYEPQSFDTVLFCEVIEHLIRDPVFALAEIYRVLQPEGRLLLTTPNVARASNVARLSQGLGIYDPYSRHGPHGRHNREYAATELFELVSRNGFEIERYLTRPVHSVTDPGPDWFAARDDDGTGDYHFLVLRRAAPAPPFRPSWLYR